MNRLTPAYHGAMQPQPPPPPGTGKLARYSSAPGSFLAALADSVTRDGNDPQPVSRFCSAEPSGLTSGESTCRTDGRGGGGRRPLERAYGGSGEIRLAPPSNQQQAFAPSRPPQRQPPATSPLFRQSSSPPGCSLTSWPTSTGASVDKLDAAQPVRTHLWLI